MATKQAGSANGSAEQFPMVITVREAPGITAKLYRQIRVKGEAEYTTYMLRYASPTGTKTDTFSNLGEAKDRAKEVILAIRDNKQAILELSAKDAELYRRAVNAVAPTGVPLDVAALEYAEARTLLN